MAKLTFYFICFIVISCVVSESKYDQKTNDTPGGNQFSMGKVIAVWEKAQKILKGPKLADLYADLIVQDKRERMLKKKKHAGQDVDGLFEADVRKEFIGILRKHHLSDFFPNERYTVNDKEVQDYMAQHEIKDDKLKKLWKTAAQEGFTAEEMATLREELGHQQMKLDEYESMKVDYDTLQVQIDNSFDNEDQEDLWKDISDKKLKMKERYRGMKDNLKGIEKKITLGKKHARQFEDPRVYQLWALAQKSGMDEAELESIRKELTHFEHRINKANYMQEQLDKKTHLEETDISAHKDLVDRTRHMNSKVEKYHDDLKYRIHKRLDEL